MSRTIGVYRRMSTITLMLSMPLASSVPAWAQQEPGAFNAVMQSATPVPQACYTIDWSQVDSAIAQLEASQQSLNSDITFLRDLNLEMDGNADGLRLTRDVNNLIGLLDVTVTAAREVAVQLDKTGQAKWLMMGADVLSSGAGAVTNAVLGTPNNNDFYGSLFKIGKAAIKQGRTKAVEAVDSLSVQRNQLAKVAAVVKAVGEKAKGYASRSSDITDLYGQMRQHQRAILDDEVQLAAVLADTEAKLRNMRDSARQVSQFCTEGNGNQSSIAAACAQLVADAGQATDGKRFAPLFARLKQACPAGDADKARAAYMATASKAQQAATAERVASSTSQALSGIGSAQASVNASYRNNSSVQSSLQSLQQARAYDEALAQQRAAQSISNQISATSSASTNKETYVCDQYGMVSMAETSGGYRRTCIKGHYVRSQ